MAGIPHPKIHEAIELEHCVKYGCDIDFTTENYNVTTCPRKEYEITTGTRPCPPDDLKDKTGKLVRIIQSIRVLEKKQMAQGAALHADEILAVVLYTGPLYGRYNMILRRYPEETYEAFRKGGNLLTTTIHVLVSAVAKVARVMKLPEGLKLYRGLGGLTELPSCFWKADGHGCRGYMEWGFMSTTSDKQIALTYSGVREGRPHAMVLEAEVGSINRGAYIGDFSQYPGEREYLWGPCSFIEPKGAQRVEVVPEGVVSVVPVGVHANLKALTVEQHRAHKRLAHLAALRCTLDETRRDLRDTADAANAQERLMRDPFREGYGETYTIEGFLGNIMERCEGVARRHEGVGAEEYLDDGVYRGLVVEMLHTKAAALAALRHYLLDTSASIYLANKISLKEAHRRYVAYLRRTLAAAGEERAAGAQGLCRVMGLMRSSVDEQDEDGQTPIMSAASDGAAYTPLHLLVAARANPDAPDQSGWTPVYFAAAYGHGETVEALHRLGASVDAAPEDGTTPVWIAASEGHVGAVAVLCRLRANVNQAQCDGVTPLYIAVQKGHVSVVEALIGAGADLNQAMNDGRTPLHIAAQFGRVKVVKVLGRAGADINKAMNDGRTPLHIAAQFGSVEVLKALARRGADVNAKDEEGDTPLRAATSGKHTSAIEALRRLGAK